MDDVAALGRAGEAGAHGFDRSEGVVGDRADLERQGSHRLDQARIDHVLRVNAHLMAMGEAAIEHAFDGADDLQET